MLRRWRQCKLDLLEEREKYLLFLIDYYSGRLKDTAEDELIVIQPKIEKLRRKLK